jgi:glycosyltransferase involved in cell wall biosynthesis
VPTQRVSIVIAAKDAEMHIQETLESFGLLDHLREIIVINDHSSDSTADIVEQFASQADVPVHLIHAEGSEPCGAARARNIGAKAATGDIFGFSMLTTSVK